MTETALDTLYLSRQAERCEDTEDLREILRQYRACYLDWRSFINDALDMSGLSYTRFAQICGVSRNALKKWCVSGGLPRSRATYIKIGFGLGMNEEEMNRLLTRYGGYPGLYAKDLFDAACSFTLRNGGSYGDAVELYRRCAEQEPVEPEQVETVLLERQLQALPDPERFLRFVQENRQLFTGQRTKLCQYLRDFLHMRQWELAVIEGHSFSLHGWAVESGLSPKYEKMLTELSLRGTLPRREQLIGLGLRLDMTTDFLNTFLELAGMEKLCARNRLECVLIYALQKIDLLHPELAFSNAQQLLHTTRDPATAEVCRRLVFEYLRNNYQSEAAEMEGVAETVEGILQELDLNEAEELIEQLCIK